MECGHNEAELRVRPYDGWIYCRLCKNEKERARRREAMKDPAKREQIRKKNRERQREWRRDPARRDAIRSQDQERHEAKRAMRLEQFRKYDKRYRRSGAFYATRYGVPLEEAKQAVESKPSECQICGRGDRPLVFDHCDETHRFRGWLCRQCNAAQGLLAHDASTVQAMANYLLNFRQKI
jgi:hypothetical protein